MFILGIRVKKTGVTKGRIGPLFACFLFWKRFLNPLSQASNLPGSRFACIVVYSRKGDYDERGKHMNDKLFNNYHFLDDSEEPSAEEKELAVEQNNDESEAENNVFDIRWVSAL